MCMISGLYQNTRGARRARGELKDEPKTRCVVFTMEQLKTLRTTLAAEIGRRDELGEEYGELEALMGVLDGSE